MQNDQKIKKYKTNYHLDEFCTGQSHNHLKRIEKANKKKITHEEIWIWEFYQFFFWKC